MITEHRSNTERGNGSAGICERGDEDASPSRTYRDTSHAELRSITETELAGWHHLDGHKVVQCHNRHWVEVAAGFYQPVHWLAQLSVSEIRRPRWLCWGIRACVHDRDRAVANALMPVHMLEDLEGYEIERLDRKYRSQVRRCHDQAEIVELTGAALLQEQGYEVMQSALRRAAYRSMPTRETYLDRLKHYLQPGRLVIGTLVGGELRAYASGFAIDGTAYCEEQFIADDALPVSAGAGMTYEFVKICRRTDGVRRVVSGLHAREDAGLCRFKNNVGFPVRFVPARAWIFAPMSAILRWRAPHKHYRLTGRE